MTPTESFILRCAPQRTPIGRYCGALSSVRPDDLAAIPLARFWPPATLNGRWAAVDDCDLGCANQAGEDTASCAQSAGASVCSICQVEC